MGFGYYIRKVTEDVYLDRKNVLFCHLLDGAAGHCCRADGVGPSLALGCVGGGFVAHSRLTQAQFQTLAAAAHAAIEWTFAPIATNLEFSMRCRSIEQASEELHQFSVEGSNDRYDRLPLTSPEALT